MGILEIRKGVLEAKRFDREAGVAQRGRHFSRSKCRGSCSCEIDGGKGGIETNSNTGKKCTPNDSRYACKRISRGSGGCQADRSKTVTEKNRVDGEASVAQRRRHTP